MEENKFEIIKKLMEELQEEMKYGPEELGDRLGRPKPDVAVMKVETDVDPMMDESEDEMMEESPEDKFKKRLMKLRG